MTRKDGSRGAGFAEITDEDAEVYSNSATVLQELRSYPGRRPSPFHPVF